MHASSHLGARAYPVWWRTIAGGLVGASRASLAAILAAVLLATDPPVTPPVLVYLFVVYTCLPRAAAWFGTRLVAAAVEVRPPDLVLRRRGLTIEVPCRSIARLTPWTVPLPALGLSVRLRSGRRLPWGLEAADPTALLAALAEAGVESARAALRHPNVVYARARAGVTPTRWYHLAGKFVLFGFLPAAVLFNTHQHIAYGGFLGEYYLYGLLPWLETLGVYWLTLVIYLVLYAGVWRGVAEGVALAAARVAPARAARVRRVAEVCCGIVYYAGVPLLLGVRYLP